MRGNHVVLTVTVTLVGCMASTAFGASTPAQKCEKTKNKAAAKYGQCIATQRGKEIGGKIPEYAECATKLTDAFTKAEQKAVAAGSGCPTTGDAAAILARANAVYDPDTALPKWFSNTRFVDNGDGTVSDTLTGLMWERKGSLDSIPNPSDPHDADNTYTWTSSGTDPDGAAFTDFLTELNDCESADGNTITGGFAGHCDWRLPTIAELQTILLAPFPCGTSPCINQTVFGPTQALFYWASTSATPISTAAWGADFNNGNTGGDGKLNGRYVRAVRGGM